MASDSLHRLTSSAHRNQGSPLICTPLVASSRDALLAELQAIVAKGPDLIEWRVDFFEPLAEVDQVVAMAAEIKAAAGGIPLLFTRRWVHEGGEAISLGEDQVLAMYEAVCASGHVDLIDYELSHERPQVERVLQLARRYGIKLILSYHNFRQTPPVDEIVQRLLDAQAAGADIAKVAVMPNSKLDVLNLLQATEAAQRRLSIPLITMSMGGFGALSRLVGGAFGSAVTFAVGQTSSAPGQMAIDEVRQVLEILERQLPAEM